VPDSPRIDGHIAAMLRGSGLPMERRAETAEEFREHLRASVDRHRRAGLPAEQAVAAALAAFGRPETIRRHLRRQQRASDRRYAAGERRRYRGLYLAIAAMCGLLPIVRCPEVVPPLWRCLGGLASFLFVSALAGVAGYLAALQECRISRRRPREEYSFGASLLRWTGLAGGSLFALVAILLLVIGAVLPFIHTVLGSERPSLLLMGAAFGQAWLEHPLRTFGLSAVLVVGLGLGAAFYERSRCVDQPPRLSIP